MKILKSEILKRNGEGFVRVEPEEAEDMWHLFNLLGAGDTIKSSTTRNVRLSIHGLFVLIKRDVGLCRSLRRAVQAQ